MTIHTAEYQTTLTYRKAERKDTGIYKLTVYNDYGEDTGEIDCVVLGTYGVQLSLLNAPSVKWCGFLLHKLGINFSDP